MVVEPTEPKKEGRSVVEIGSSGCWEDDEFVVIEEGEVDDENLIVYKRLGGINEEGKGSGGRERSEKKSGEAKGSS